MFRDEGQINEVCSVLLERAALRGYWTGEGPTKKAHAVMEEGAALSSGERIMVMAAHALWSAQGRLEFADLLKLDDSNLESIGSLLVAVAAGENPRAIDEWIERHRAS